MPNEELVVCTVPKKGRRLAKGPPEGDLCYAGRHICRWADVCGRVGKLTTGMVREGPGTRVVKERKNGPSGASEDCVW